MKNLNGIQLYQQIKSIDPTIKILFVTALDILNQVNYNPRYIRRTNYEKAC